jgi:cellulose biosynthesis protein BcsQ
MKRLILILNGKGGVGKSFFAVNLVQYLKDKGIAHVAIDSDNENSTLKRFHPDAVFVALAERRGPDTIFNTLEQANLVVMDCRAASTDLFIDFFAEINFASVLSALGASLTLVMPVNHESDSVDQVQRLADEFDNKCGYVVVRNAAHSKNFALYEGAEVRAQIKDRLGGKEISMAQLPDWLVVALNAQNLTISAAVKHPDFSLLDRQRLQTWQHNLYSEIESAIDLLLPTKP